MKKNKKRGLQITIAFHVLLLLILLLSNFPVPEPVFPDPDGIQINFGDSEDGAGMEEPNAEEPETAETTPVEEAVTEPTPAETAPTEPIESIEENLTQDFEDAPSVEEQKKREEQKKIEKQKRIEREKQLAKQREIDAEKQRIENERLAEQKRIEAIKNRAKNAFGRSDKSSTGQGNTTGNKNQGGKNGSEDSKHTKGIGNGNGISFVLNGRSSVSLHAPKSEVQAEGVVVVEIIVNRNGEVVEARPGVVGSTTTDGRLFEIAKKAALKTKFNTDDSAADRQKGTIKYVFELH